MGLQRGTFCRTLLLLLSIQCSTVTNSGIAQFSIVRIPSFVAGRHSDVWGVQWLLCPNSH